MSALIAALGAGLLVALSLLPEPYVPLASRRLRRALAEMGRDPVPRPTGRLGLLPRLLLRLPVAALGRWLARLAPAGYRQAVERRLLLARLQDELTFAGFLQVKAAAALLLSAYFLLLALRAGGLLWWLTLAMAYLGAFVPDQWLFRQVGRRQRQIGRELPATLSALAITTEAGLLLGTAVAEVGRGRSGVLAEELRWAADQMRLGVPQGAALEAMAARCQVPELTLVIAALVQSFEKGSRQVVATLRSQAAEAWAARRRRAEELAQQASIKLFLPLVLMVFPAIMIFLLGPAVLSLIQFFAQRPR